MKKLGLLLLTAVLTLSTVVATSAQGLGTMSRYFLLLNPKVQAELKLTDSQKGAIKKAFGDSVSTDAQGRFRVQISQGTDLESLKPALKKAITPAQAKRLREIWLQRDQGLALSDPEIAKELGLTADQSKKVGAIMADQQQELRDVAVANGGRVELAETKAIREKTGKKLKAVLMPVQVSKLEALKGKPFKAK